MDPKKRKTVIVLIFIIAVIWGAMNLIEPDRGTMTGMNTSSKSDSHPVTVDQYQKATDLEKYARLEWGEDPFCRGSRDDTGETDESEPVEWSLDGIMYSAGNPMAVINKSVVGNGDMIRGARVVDIGKTGVILEKDGTKFSLNMAEGKS